MEIVGIGIDIIEVKRIHEALIKHPRIALKLFTENEMKSCQMRANQYEELSGRYAAKEALLKAIGIGWRQGVKFNEIEIKSEPSGKPYIEAAGRVAELVNKLGAKKIFLTITHTEEQAIAEVILTR